jgi:predicted regulator of Ras-like GTPase activity (Roadblock/LC7/MglB family)
MGSLPQLIEEDIKEIDSIFSRFVKKAEAQSILLLAEGGFLVCSYGNTDGLDTMSLGALASNSFEANRMIAGLMGEPNFSSIYQAGEHYSMFVQSIDGYNVMVVIFPVTVGVGLVRHYAQSARDEVARVFTRAKERAPAETLDLAMMNVADSSQIFRRNRKAS